MHYSTAALIRDIYRFLKPYQATFAVATFFRILSDLAHRLTTIREMDRIIVIEHGRVIESGIFDELTAKRERFFEVWEKQRL